MRKVQIMVSLNMVSPFALRNWMAGFSDVHIDLGTGDGSYALHVARSNLDMAVIGIDTCLDNLTKAARKGMPNLRFLVGDATAPPTWLHRTATRVSINFPYGSLLRALMAGDESSRKLFAIARPGTRIEIRVNGSAAKELEMPAHVVEARLQQMLRATGAGRTLSPTRHFAVSRANGRSGWRTAGHLGSSQRRRWGQSNPVGSSAR